MSSVLLKLRQQSWLLMLCWFCLAMLSASYVSELMYDDAFNASVAKNLSLGLGWISSYHQPVWFNPRVTTGPSLMIPLAGASALLGNPEWLPSIVATSLMLVALVMCLVALKKLISPADFPVLAICILLLLSFYDRNTWLVFIGDGVLALSLCWIMLRLGPLLNSATDRDWLWLGIAVGFALLCKFYALIALVALPLLWLIYRLDQRPVIGNSWRQWAWLALGTAALLLPWQLYRELSLAGLSDNQQLTREMLAVQFVSGGSGLGPLLAADNIGAHLGANLQRNFNVLVNALSVSGKQPLPVIVFLAANAAATLYLLKTRKRDARHWSLLALGLALCAHLTWFLLFQHGPWPHYVRIPLILSIFFWPLLLQRYLRALPTLVALVALLVLLPAKQRDNWLNFSLLGDQVAATSIARLQLLEHLNAASLELPLAGCGWLTLRALEYQLPGSGHLRDCMMLVQAQLRADGFSRHTVIEGPVLLSAPVEFLIPTYEKRWNWAGRGHTIERDMVRHCQQRLYQNRFYELLQCRVEELDEKTARYINQYRFAS